MNKTRHRSINDKYNMVVFTDASKYKGLNPTGSIIYRLFTPGYNDIDLKTKHYCFSKIQLWEAEANLIVKGLELFKNSYGGIDNIIFFCDSVKALRSLKHNEEYVSLKKYFYDRDIKVLLKKVKAHSQNKLNDMADFEAKRAMILRKQNKQGNGLIYV